MLRIVMSVTHSENSVRAEILERRIRWPHNTHNFLFRIRLNMDTLLVVTRLKISCLGVLVFMSFGCGARKVKPPKDTVCKIGIQRLKQKLGPELGRIVRKLPIYRPKRSVHACAIVYRRLAEETPDELPEDEAGDFQIDDRLALVTVSKRVPRFRKVPGSVYAPGPVKVTLKAADVNGDSIVDFIVLENAPLKGTNIGYKGLRLFDGAPGRGHEILSLNLKITTDEGLDLIPRWRMYRNATGSFVELSGGGKTIVYRYDSARKRFVKNKSPATMGSSTPKATSGEQKTKKPVQGEQRKIDSVQPSKPKAPQKPKIVLPFL